LETSPSFSVLSTLKGSVIGKMYVICALLENARTCLYGNIVSTFSALQPPALFEYFN
jgi:hypothetical protein